MLQGVEGRRRTVQATPVRFSPAVILTKEEVFEACDWLATAGRLLHAHGHSAEASRASALFMQLEDRLAARWPDSEFAQSAFSGSKSSERELTQ